MDILLILLIAFSLAIDAFAVALGVGSYFGKTSNRQKFRLSFHFGLFQFIMPLIGWLAGNEIINFISDYANWFAIIILCTIGIKMIKDSFGDYEEKVSKDMTRGMSLINLSIATSIDALAIGFSIGIIGEKIVLPSIIIGIVAAAMTLLGIKLGETFSGKFGKKISILGGIILIIIAIKIMVEQFGLR